MPLLTDKDLQKLASAAAVDLVDNNIPLNTTISKVASEMSLTQEQIKRLCEASNNQTFNRMFTSKDKTASDRMVEFDVAESDKILGGQIKAASDTTYDAVSELRELRPLPDLVNVDDTPVYEKTASVDEQRRDARLEAMLSEHDTRSLGKVQDYLRHEKIANTTAYRDTLCDLAQDFRRLYNDIPFEEFEKTAVAVWGESGAAVMNDLRETCRKNRIEYNVEGLTKIAGYRDDTHPAFAKFKDALAYRDKNQNIDQAMIKLRGSL